jgi:hypothetical protein
MVTAAMAAALFAAVMIAIAVAALANASAAVVAPTEVLWLLPLYLVHQQLAMCQL